MIPTLELEAGLGLQFDITMKFEDDAYDDYQDPDPDGYQKSSSKEH